MKPITKRYYKTLLTRLNNAELQVQIHPDSVGTKAHYDHLKQVVADYSVPCPGFAHQPDGFWQDNCMVCAPQWGQVLNPALTKS